VFAELMREREPLPYLGDTMFEWLARRLARGSSPLLRIEPAPEGEPWFRDSVHLTATGERVLEGTVNRLDLGPGERWIGGVATPGEGGSWCWDGRRGCPVWRAA
jgi:hypothetical protein